jgi:hypothetical protein
MKANIKSIKQLTGLGVHATLDLGGRFRFGLDTEYVENIDDIVDEKKMRSFLPPRQVFFQILKWMRFIQIWQESDRNYQGLATKLGIL